MLETFPAGKLHRPCRGRTIEFQAIAVELGQATNFGHLAALEVTAVVAVGINLLLLQNVFRRGPYAVWIALDTQRRSAAPVALAALRFCARMDSAIELLAHILLVGLPVAL